MPTTYWYRDYDALSSLANPGLANAQLSSREYQQYADGRATRPVFFLASRMYVLVPRAVLRCCALPWTPHPEVFSWSLALVLSYINPLVISSITAFQEYLPHLTRFLQLLYQPFPFTPWWAV